MEGIERHLRRRFSNPAESVSITHQTAYTALTLEMQVTPLPLPGLPDCACTEHSSVS